MKRMVLALTGASGVIYGIRMAQELLIRDYEVHLIASDAACIVLEQELDWDFNSGRAQTFYQHLPGSNLVYYDNDDIAAVLASGSFQSQGMIVMPCTMSTLSAITYGSSDNLITRVADVMLKEKRQLILVPRETPLSTIHLRNMLLLSEMGVSIVPAMPGFYSKPTSLDDIVNFLVGKVLDLINIPNDLYHRYA